jgi:hypothetical protein
VEKGDRDGVLKESADTLEILLALLSKFGLSIDDLITMQKKRREARGGFDCGFFLESVDGKCPDCIVDDYPSFLSTKCDSSCLIDLLKSELARSDRAWMAI